MPKYTFAIMREHIHSDLGEMDLPDNETAIQQLLNFAREEAIDESDMQTPTWSAILRDGSGETIATRDFGDLVQERVAELR